MLSGRFACSGLFFIALLIPFANSRSAEPLTEAPAASTYALGFEISDGEDGGSIQVFRTGESRQPLTFIHWQPERAHSPGEVALAESLQRVVLTSTTYLPHFEALDAVGLVVGVVDAGLISSPSFREALASGKIVAVGQGAAVDVESIIKLQPDAVFMSAFEASHGSLMAALQRARIPVIQTTAFEEVHPLGRAEWIRFFGRLLGRYEEAEEIFRGIESRYDALAEIASGVEDRPKVLTNSPWGGVWYLPGSDGYKAQFIRDAGGTYALNLPGVATRPLPFEEVFRQARNADVWIDCGVAENLAGLVATDQRYRLFSAVREGRVYHNRGELSPGGGNNLFERGGLFADEVLADHLAIFHPHLLPDHALRYYRRLLSMNQ